MQCRDEKMWALSRMVPVEMEKCAAEPTQLADTLDVGVRKMKGSKMILVFG